jgi:hypothetical protein
MTSQLTLEYAQRHQQNAHVQDILDEDLQKNTLKLRWGLEKVHMLRRLS